MNVFRMFMGMVGSLMLAAGPSRADLAIPSGVQTFVDWHFDTAGPGGVDSGASATDWSSTSLVDAGWITLAATGDQTTFAVNTGASRLDAFVRDSGGVQSTLVTVLPFNQDAPAGYIASRMRTTIGNSTMIVGLYLGHYDGSTATKLGGFYLEHSSPTISSFMRAETDTDFTTPSGLGLGEDLSGNHLYEFAWDNNGLDLQVTRNGDGAKLFVTDRNFIGASSLTPNALIFERPVGFNSTAARGLTLDTLSVQLVPEPSSALLVVLGCVGLAAWRHRR